MEDTKNGYVRWWQLSVSSISLLAIMVTIALFAANQAIAIDERSNHRDDSIQEKMMQYFNKNNDDHIKIMNAVQDMALDVRELKVKLGGAPHERNGI